MKETLKKVLNNNISRDFIDELLELHAYEQSEYFNSLSKEERQQLFEILSPEEIAYFYGYLDWDNDRQQEIFEEMNAEYACKILELMSDDDAVDILNQLTKEQRTSLLALMDKNKSDHFKLMMNYGENTAGGIMTKEYVSLSPDMTVREALVHVKERSGSAQTIYILYVVDEHKKLAAVMSLRELINADMNAHVKDVMTTDLIFANIAEDQEDVARKIQDYNLNAIPVLDYQGHLVGIVTVDDILDVMEEEANEDFSKFAAVSEASDSDDSVLQTTKKRLPWLIILTFLGMITATILGTFEDTLSQVALLAAFIPIISGMSGNSGTQSLAVSVRQISTGEVKDKSKWKLALKESGSGFLSGLVCAVLIFIVIVILYQEPYLAVIVAISLNVAMTVGTTVGSIIPLFMNKIGIDPAVASGPFITTINDIISMLIYFGLATSLMSYLI